MALARIQVPKEAKRGELVTVRVAIQHPMETGFRYDNMGKPIPKNVINTLVCRYNGAEVFRAEMGSGISANPRDRRPPGLPARVSSPGLAASAFAGRSQFQ